jgi:hypothetical protein
MDLDLDLDNLDLSDYSFDNNSTVTISSGTNILDSLSTDSFTLNSTWDTSYNDTITIGGQTLTEHKLKALDGLQEWQEEVNKKLAILQPNPKLEEEWEELKELRQRYVELEKELTEKSKMWAILKDTQKDTR